MIRFGSCAMGVALVLATASYGGAAESDEGNFLSRFNGSWSGSGTVSRKENEDPTRVKCTMKGEASTSSLSMRGKCGALIFSRNVSADIQYDPSSGRYSGTYVGSAIGAARVSGKRQGDAVVLTITWPKPVRGDTKATMTISNAGSGQVGITVTDEISKDGPTAQVSNIQLSQN